MPRGTLHDPESLVEQDPATGASVRRVTSHRSIHHHPFYYVPAYDDAMRFLFFVSHRTGRPEVFAELRDRGRRLLQMTEHAGLAEWSIHPSHDGGHLYFTDDAGGWRVDTHTLAEECLFRFDAGAGRAPGMVGAAMGTTTLSRDDRWWAVPLKLGPVTRLELIDTRSGQRRTIVEAKTIGHPQFHPDDPSWLRYAGEYDQRIWIVRRDGSGRRLLFERDAAAKQWIVHETWRPGTMEVLTADWPHGVLGVDALCGSVRRVCAFNAWHPMVDRTGRWIVTDTVFPDRGLRVFAADGDAAGLAATRALCYPGASNAGDHWGRGHCPYDDEDFRAGTARVYAPQHTHPHPNFSPDGGCVVFTSDRGGFAQVYEVEITPD